MAFARVSNRMRRDGRANPGMKHLAGADVTAKMQRQYADILASLRSYGRYRTDAKRKQVAAATVRKLAKGNPLNGDEAGAISVAEDFHGRPVDEFVDIEEREAYTEFGGQLGELMRLDILTEDAGHYQTINFDFQPDASDNIRMISDAVRKNIEFVGGDQSFNWRAIEGASETEKNLILVGPVVEIDYWSDKYHLGGAPAEQGGYTYFHKFGDEGGEIPWLVYDTRNEKLLFVGGDYTIEPEGITG